MQKPSGTLKWARSNTPRLIALPPARDLSRHSWRGWMRVRVWSISGQSSLVIGHWSFVIGSFVGLDHLEAVEASGFAAYEDFVLLDGGGGKGETFFTGFVFSVQGVALVEGFAVLGIEEGEVA